MSGIRPPAERAEGPKPGDGRDDRQRTGPASGEVAADADRLRRLLREGSRPHTDKRGEPAGGDRVEGDRHGTSLRDRLDDPDERDEGGGGQQEEHGHEPGQDSPETEAQGFRGDAILAGLGAGTVTSPAQTDKAAENRHRELYGLVGAIVDRVLVGEREGNPELRITLRGEIWGQSELQITRGDGGLAITILAGNEASSAILARRGQDLAGQLAEKLDTRVVLQVAAPQESDLSGGGEGRQERRSSGLDALLTYAAG